MTLNLPSRARSLAGYLTVHSPRLQAGEGVGTGAMDAERIQAALTTALREPATLRVTFRCPRL